MKKFTRKNQKTSLVEDLTNAQKLVFAPLAFQAISTAIELGILEFLDKKSSTVSEIMSGLNLDEYVVKTLLQVTEANKITKKTDEKYSLTRLGKMFLYDDMTKANFNYVKDVCYLGASELTSSFLQKSPMGLKKFVGDFPTIYPALTVLPEKMKKSWYEFDHLYSDNCFEFVLSIIGENYSSIYDIGGNTGNFEKLCLKNNFDITMLDLAENIEKIKDDVELKGCKFHPINVLDKNPAYPKITNSAIFMSQFLDCFSKEDIVKILTDLSKTTDEKSSIYILEPYTDEQKFEGAKYSLVHTSLYFTCMANGVSKFYTLEEMREMLTLAGLTITRHIPNVGAYDYTLLECRKNAVVSG